MSTTNLIVAVEPDQRRWIRTVAARNGITVAAMVRTLVDRLHDDEDFLAWCVEHAAAR